MCVPRRVRMLSSVSRAALPRVIAQCTTSMSLLSMPTDVLHEILSLVTPPLPVPTSTTSHLPELLDYRGDNMEAWKDVSSLMLVSKVMKVNAYSL